MCIRDRSRNAKGLVEKTFTIEQPELEEEADDD